MKVNWDDNIPNIWKNKSHVPVTTNQGIIMEPSDDAGFRQHPHHWDGGKGAMKYHSIAAYFYGSTIPAPVQLWQYIDIE